MNNKRNDRIIVVKISTETTDCIYLPSSGSNISCFREYLKNLEDIVNKFIYSGTVVVAGDLNAHIRDHSGPKCLNSVINDRGKML